ncbi:TetR/AcrR family transcriptional regulator [Nocardia sp. NPDC058176]|uniref:TetR/AcrR family transcriptional regulator n=1 Tax=Nocardia sp. NPDC058176 TaxID=3346368 RepID=UPI0036D812C2
MPPKAVDRRRQPTQERAKATRERILDTAAELFGERGIAQTSTNLIATTAGISIGTLYRYFSDRSILVEEILERLIADAEREFAERVFDLPTAVDPRSLDDYIRVAAEILDVFAEVLVAKAALVRALVASVQFYSSGLPELEPRLRLLVKLVLINYLGPGNDRDNEMMARVLINTGFAAVLRASADGISDTDRESSIAMTARMIGTWLHSEER